MSYGWLRETSNRLANVLAARGIRRGDRVAILLPQAPAVAAAHVAIYKLGAIALPLAMLFGVEAISYRLGDSGARALITNAQGLAKLAGIPDGKKLKEGAGIDSIVRAAGSIELEDVRKPAAPATPGGEAGTAKIEADGGLAVTLKLRKEGEDYWATLEASGGEGEAKKAADEITAKAQGWEFKIPAGKAQSILKRRVDLVEAS